MYKRTRTSSLIYHPSLPLNSAASFLSILFPLRGPPPFSRPSPRADALSLAAPSRSCRSVSNQLLAFYKQGVLLAACSSSSNSWVWSSSSASLRCELLLLLLALDAMRRKSRYYSRQWPTPGGLESEWVATNLRLSGAASRNTCQPAVLTL